jgi:hypothetical protein
MLLLFYATAYSQYGFRPGYIVKLDGGTEDGLINLHGSAFNAKKCEFKKDSTSAPVIYLPTDIEAYRIKDSKYFISKKVLINNVETNVFLECLISGKVSVYYTNWDSQDIYFSEKDGVLTEIDNNLIDIERDGNKYEVHSNQYKRVLKSNFMDCPAMFPKVDNADFSKKTLIKLSKEYHDYVCKDEQCIIYEKKQSKIHVRLGGDFAYGTSKLKYANPGLYFSCDPISCYQFNINAHCCPLKIS